MKASEARQIARAVSTDVSKIVEEVYKRVAKAAKEGGFETQIDLSEHNISPGTLLYKKTLASIRAFARISLRLWLMGRIRLRS